MLCIHTKKFSAGLDDLQDEHAAGHEAHDGRDGNALEARDTADDGDTGALERGDGGAVDAGGGRVVGSGVGGDAGNGGRRAGDSARGRRDDGGTLDTRAVGRDLEHGGEVLGVRVLGLDLDRVVVVAGELGGGNPDEGTSVGESACGRLLVAVR